MHDRLCVMQIGTFEGRLCVVGWWCVETKHCIHGEYPLVISVEVQPTRYIPEITFHYGSQRSCAKVMFLCLSVILSNGGVCHTQTHTQRPWADTPLGQTPPCPVHAGIHTPFSVHDAIRSTSDRYASYWNAFLFLKCI